MQPSRTALVVQKGDHSLGFYALPGGAEIARVPIDPFPHELALSPDRSLALVTHFGVALAEDEGPGGNTVSVVDVRQQRRVAVIDCETYRRPHGIVFDASGRAYILSEGTSRLLVAGDPARGRIDRVLPTGGDGSHMVSVTLDGRLAFCSNMRSNTVTVVDTDRPDRAPSSIPVGARPEGSVLDAGESTLYVVNRESGDISVIDVAGRSERRRIHTGPGPVRLCWDARGMLLVALYHTHELAVVDPSSGTVEERLRLPGAPISIAFSPATGAAYLSTLAQEVLIVDIESMALAGRFTTRADPDPVAVLP